MFSIPRYQGDDDESQSHRSYEKKQERLQKLIEKANRKRQPPIDEKDDSSTTTTTNTKKDKRRKKEKEHKVDNEQLNEMDHTETMPVDDVQEAQQAQISVDMASKEIDYEQDEEEDSEGRDNEDDDDDDKGIVAFPDMMGKQQKQSKDEIQLLRKMGIPDWLLQPTIISPSDKCDIESIPGLSTKLIRRCKELDITSFFAVQMAVIPVFLRRQALYDTRRSPGDLCVSAPTGSGKTMAYVLPIIEILSKRVVTRLRALVVLPTRELAIQVKETFEAFVKGTGLKVGSAIGQHTLRREQQALVGKPEDDDYMGGQSRVDILVATPGRLTDHIRETPNFTLQHLRFLVIDEADQLLNHSYNDWLNHILNATRPQSHHSTNPLSFKKDQHGVLEADAIAPYFMRSHFDLPRTDVDIAKAPTVQKLLFSATLTKNPAKIAGLHLTEPEYIAVQRSEDMEDKPDYTTPEGLTEYMTVTSAERKPLMLLYIMHTFNIQSCLCFTRSAESTQQLKTLVEAYESRQSTHDTKIVVADYSSDLPPSERKSLLKRFKNGDIHLLVCSDLIGRGIDLNNVDVVINYDVPWFMDKYIHRVGRTARAGREGQAYSLVEKQEARPFKDLLRNAGHYQQIKQLRVENTKLEPMQADYDAALSSVA